MGTRVIWRRERHFDHGIRVGNADTGGCARMYGRHLALGVWALVASCLLIGLIETELIDGFAWAR